MTLVARAGAVAPRQVGLGECVKWPLTELGLHHPPGLAVASEAMLGTGLSGGGSRRNEGQTERGQLTEEPAGSGACVPCRDAYGAGPWYRAVSGIPSGEPLETVRGV